MLGSDQLSRPTTEASRRRVLQLLGIGSAAGLAGCTGFGGDGGDGGVDPVQDRVTVNPDDIVEGGTFKCALGAGPDTLDYPFSSSAEATTLMNLIYEGMITTNAAGEIYDWLAESYERQDVQDVDPVDYEQYMIEAEYDDNGVPQTDAQIVVRHPDNDPSSGPGQFMTVEQASDAVDDGTYGMHYRFELHEGITFHDGEELTADNVVASYERIQGSPLAGQVYDSLLDVVAEGDYTVDIYAQIPDAAFVRNLGGLPVYPSAMTDLPPEEMTPTAGNTPLGSGPFMFSEYEDQEFYIFETNDDYWFDTEMKDWFDGPDGYPDGPVVDEVDVSIVEDPSTRSASLQSGEIDLARGLTASSLGEYDTSEDYRVAPTDGAGFTFMQFPVRVEPWTDRRLRRAVNHLIPREDIAENIFEGWENPAWVPMPPIAATDGTTDYEALVEDLRSYNEYDVEEAESLAQEAVDDMGIETPIEITLETNSDNTDRVRTVELIQESMNNTEYFDASLNTMGFNEFVVRILSPEYYEKGRISFIGLSGGFGPHGYAKSIHHPDNFAACCNFQNIDNDELNDMLQDARYGVDVVEDAELRRERYDEIWEQILEINANSYGTHSQTISVMNDAIKGYNTYPSVQDFIGYGLYDPTDAQLTYIDR